MFPKPWEKKKVLFILNYLSLAGRVNYREKEQKLIFA